MCITDVFVPTDISLPNQNKNAFNELQNMGHLKITKELIASKFDECNRKYFNGILEPCKFHTFRMPRTFGMYGRLMYKGKYVGNIWIASNVKWTEEAFTETVIHEMIHHYITTIEKHESIIFKHGWRFKRQCRRLKREFGITIDLYGPKVCHVGNKKPTVPSLFTRFRRFIGLQLVYDYGLSRKKQRFYPLIQEQSNI